MDDSREIRIDSGQVIGLIMLLLAMLPRDILLRENYLSLFPQLLLENISLMGKCRNFLRMKEISVQMRALIDSFWILNL